MHIGEATVGDYRIYAGALEAEAGGYQAAVVVKRIGGVSTSTAANEAFRDTALSGGQCWQRADEALAFALQAGRQLVSRHPHLLSC